VNALVVATAAALLAIERLAYVWIWYRPQQFASLCERRGGEIDPVEALQRLFRMFKVLQISVFLGWCVWWGQGELRFHQAEGLPLALGLAMVGLGQALNFAVFHRLGTAGVFYGVRFGHDIPWCSRFPFSVMENPQYVGAVLSIWGFFLIARFPEPDWLVLPMIETVYYALGARFEGQDE